MIGLAYLALGASVFFLVGWILAATSQSEEKDDLRRELVAARQLLYENGLDYAPVEVPATAEAVAALWTEFYAALPEMGDGT